MKLNLNLKTLKTLEGWVALMSLAVVVLNIGLLIIGVILRITEPYSSRLLEQYGISAYSALWILATDFLLILIWFILFKIFKKTK
jgi:hypothetical protein